MIGRASALRAAHFAGLVAGLAAVEASGQSGYPAGQGQATPQSTARAPSAAESALLQALRANPATAPYPFATQVSGGRVILRGRVGSKIVHDVAIRTAIALGIPFDDGLVIDTAMNAIIARQAAQGGYGPAGGGLAYGPNGAGYGGPGYGAAGAGAAFGPVGPAAGSPLNYFPSAMGYGGQPYVYPTPLFSGWADPFVGVDPPAIAYPPWWPALSAQRLGEARASGAIAGPAPVNPNGNFPGGNFAGGMAGAGPGGVDTVAESSSVPLGTVDMAIDPAGVATLRGMVPTLTDRVSIGQQVAKLSGVSRVNNFLIVQPDAFPKQVDAAAKVENTPLNPAPAEANAQANLNLAPNGPGVGNNPQANADAGSRPILSTPRSVGGDPGGLAARVSKAIADHPPIASLPVRVKASGDSVTLSGKVPTAMEAMQVFRAAQQTPGVNAIDDQLEFTVPDGSTPNPLVEKGRPEDVEPYLEAQIRRQVGDIAHVDRIRVGGDSLDLKGSLARESDRDRFDAVLRSMPLLRGFKVDQQMPSNAP